MAQLRLRRAMCCAILALWPPVALPAQGARPRPAPLAVQVLPSTTMWTRYWDVRVRARPDGPVLTQLDIDQQVRVTGTTVVLGARWDRVRLWGVLDSWIRADLLAVAPLQESLASGVPVAPHPAGPHAPMPLRSTAVADGPGVLRTTPSLSAPASGALAAGAHVAVSAWATDAAGRAWYRVITPSGWVSAGAVNLTPGAGLARLSALRGLGMWCTPPVLDAAPAEVLIAAARRNHVTHLYVEVAGSRDGFWGADALGRILHVAHAAHIAVIAWVYPFLDDLPHDVAVTLQAARYRAPDGERPDGLMADVEQNMQEPYVRAYGQVLRALLGPKALMAITTYPPQTYWGRIYPFRTVARSWDLIAPQDYWRVTRRPYSAREVYRYVMESLAGIRAATGHPDVPVEVLGQTFDIFGSGINSPSGAEILAAAHAERDGHAYAISFFEWNHATPEEWDALGRIGAGATRA